jgi:hypothetical protein
MHWLDLPPPSASVALAFQDVAGAQAWLAAQPQAQVMHMLTVLREQIEAIDASGLPPPRAAELLQALRSPVVTLCLAVEGRFTRKALPMPAEEQKLFIATQGLWAAHGLVCLRLSAHFAGQEKATLLHRASVAIRQAQYCHFQAAQELPPQLDRWLFGILAQAESSGLLRTGVKDREFPHLGESHIAGQLAWAFLLRLVDPYHLSAPQLAVANRALSRWRELAGFQSMPDDDPKARAVPLEPLFGGALPEGLPRWLDVRPVTRKIRRRIESLHDGETPEDLKLGRELSAAACIRLLTDLDEHLRDSLGTPATEVGEIDLLFGGESAYELFTGNPLNVQVLNEKSSAIANKRMEVFGFDRVSRAPNVIRKSTLPYESWQVVDGLAIREADGKNRRQSPCLVSAVRNNEVFLGVLNSLRFRPDGNLCARLFWFETPTEGCVLRQSVPGGGSGTPVPVFLLHEEEGLALVAPPNAGIRINVGLNLAGASIEHLLPFEVLERGADFVRYACAEV